MDILTLILLILLFALVPLLPLSHLLIRKKRVFVLKSWDFLLWLKDDFFTEEGIQCLFCDKINLGYTVLVLLIIPAFFLPIFYFNFIRSIISLTPAEDLLAIFTLIIFGVCLILLILLFLALSSQYLPLISGNEKGLQYPESDELSDDEDHIAIILGHYTKLPDNLFVSDCIGLLIEECKKTNTKYKIYHIFEPKNFEDAYYNDHTNELWILGHGDRGGLCYGKKGDDYIEYSKLNRLALPKKFIVQLHCNNVFDETGPSLMEINQCDGFVSKHYRMFFQNRSFIIKNFKK
jgi:hypothetical protein